MQWWCIYKGASISTIYLPIIPEQWRHLLMADQQVVTTAAAAPWARCKACFLVARAAFSNDLWVALHKMSSNISDKTSPCTNWLLLVRSSLTSGSKGSSTLAKKHTQMSVNYNAGYRVQWLVKKYVHIVSLFIRYTPPCTRRVNKLIALFSLFCTIKNEAVAW